MVNTKVVDASFGVDCSLPLLKGEIAGYVYRINDTVYIRLSLQSFPFNTNESLWYPLFARKLQILKERIQITVLDRIAKVDILDATITVSDIVTELNSWIGNMVVA